MKADIFENPLQPSFPFKMQSHADQINAILTKYRPLLNSYYFTDAEMVRQFRDFFNEIDACVNAES